MKKNDHISKVSDYIVSQLKSLGVKDLFLVPGDANVHLLDSIGRDEQLRFICSETEQGAVFAAEAYGKIQNEPGVLIISSGASCSNALTGVANAWVDSTPLIIISGQARTDQCVTKGIRQLGN